MAAMQCAVKLAFYKLGGCSDAWCMGIGQIAMLFNVYSGFGIGDQSSDALIPLHTNGAILSPGSRRSGRIDPTFSKNHACLLGC